MRVTVLRIDIGRAVENDSAMATLTTTPHSLRVSLSRSEKLLGLLRDLEVPLSAVRAVEVVPDGLAAARGVRAPGLGLPGVRKVGTWRGRDGRTLVSVRRGQPGVRISLAGQRVDTVLVGVDDAAAVAGDLAATR
jgi:hypothetical protein